MAKARTAKQRAALRKAQLASARKRKRGGKGKRRINGRRVAVTALGAGVGYGLARQMGVRGTIGAVAGGGLAYGIHKRRSRRKKK